MEVDEIQRQVCKFQRISNNGSKIAHKGELELEQPYPDDEEDVRMVKKSSGGSTTMDMMVGSGARLCGWPSSRIVRVSRASGGKDRHSKVLTSKGLRDRRVRLSVTTAIQFYDLQDRLGYDQPSKAVEWLLKAAASSIAELPSLNTCFENTPNQLSDEKRRSESEEFDGGDLNYHHHQQQNQNNVSSLSKSACSSTSETSKGSGLSLSRSEIRIKARERARERAKEKDNNESTRAAVNVMNQNQHVNPISQNSSSFTDLLNGHGGISISSPSPNHNNNTTPMDYGFFTPSSSRPQTTSGFSSQIHMGNSSSMPPQYQQNHNHSHFSFLQENFVPVATSIGVGGESYNLNFSISPGLVGFNRGTLQSNIPSLLPHLQRFPPTDGTSSNLPFFVGTVPPNDNHLFPTGYDAPLQLCYGDSDQKGKGKN